MNKSTQLTRKSVHTTAWSFAGLACSLISGILTARMLGPDDRGALAVVLTVAGIGTLISALGTNVALRVYLPTDPRVTVKIYRRLSAKLAVLCLVLLLPMVLFLAGPVNEDLRKPVVLLCIAALVLSFFCSNQTLDCFNALHMAAKSARIDACGSCCTAVLVIVGWVTESGLAAAILAYVVGFSARAIVGTVLLSLSAPSVDPSIPPGGERLLLTRGIPLLGVNVGQAVMMRIDQVLVGVLLGSHAAGLYAVAATPAGVLAVVSNSIGQVTFAEAAYGRVERKLLVRQVLLAVTTTTAVAAVGVAALPWILPALFGQQFSESVRIAQLLLITQVLLSPYLVLSRAAAGYAMVRVAATTGLLGTALILGTTLVLAPRLGLPGVSLACGLTYGALTAVIVCVLSIRRPWLTTDGSSRKIVSGT